MTLASLLNVPYDASSWLQWSFANMNLHDLTVRAIQAQNNVFLQTYVLDPIPKVDFQGWLRRHQQAHNDFTTQLGINGSDLSELNPKDHDEFNTWILNHWSEHQQANQILRI